MNRIQSEFCSGNASGGAIQRNGLTTALIEKLNLNKENFDVFKFAVKRELAYDDFGFSDTGDKEFMAQFKKDR